MRLTWLETIGSYDIHKLFRINKDISSNIFGVTGSLVQIGIPNFLFSIVRIIDPSSLFDLGCGLRR